MTPGFDKPMVKGFTSDGRNFIFAESLTFTHPNGESYTIEVGDSSDGASSPRAAWSVIPPFGKYWKSAALHDSLYRKAKWPKDKCDSWFKTAMELEGVNLEERVTLYEAVHLGGQSSFDEDRQAQFHFDTPAKA